MQPATVFRNDLGVFETAAFLEGDPGPVAWGDYDDDGDLDPIVAGAIHRNDGGFFTLAHDLRSEIPHVRSLDLGDMDGDYDLDILVTGGFAQGFDAPYIRICLLYTSDAADDLQPV